MKLSTRLSLMCVLAAFVLVPAVRATPSVVEGTISSIGADHLKVNGRKYAVETEGSDRAVSTCSSRTRVFLPDNREITFGTIAGVGYVDHARVLVDGGCVLTINILEIQQ